MTVEDLLRLKRAERPSSDFWANFEVELRQKQLTALVKKRHWWHEVPSMLNRRVYLPVGATAIVAFTLVTVRYSAPTQMAQVVNTAPQIASADPAIETLAPTVVAVTDQVQSVAVAKSLVAESSPAIAATTTSVAEIVASAADKQTPQESSLTSTNRPVVTNLARLEQFESAVGDMAIDSRLGAPVRVQSSAASRPEMVSQTETSSSKYRLIARYTNRALSPAPAAPAVVRERLARRLGDDLGDNISRIGVIGDRVSLKF